MTETHSITFKYNIIKLDFMRVLEIFCDWFGEDLNNNNVIRSNYSQVFNHKRNDVIDNPPERVTLDVITQRYICIQRAKQQRAFLPAGRFVYRQPVGKPLKPVN